MNDDDKIRSSLQIIVGALAGGVVIYLAVVWWLWQQEPPRVASEGTPLLSNMSAIMLGGALVARLVVRKFMNSLEHGWRQSVVIGAALIEGAGLFGCTAYLLEGTDLAFSVGVISVPLMLFLQFPTKGRWEQWSNTARLDGSNIPSDYST